MTKHAQYASQSNGANQFITKCKLGIFFIIQDTRDKKKFEREKKILRQTKLNILSCSALVPYKLEVVIMLD